jgi:hypothetical protein
MFEKIEIIWQMARLEKRLKTLIQKSASVTNGRI